MVRAVEGAAPSAVWPVCVAGAIALAVAMGIGRFAFTPLLPLMQREGLLDGNDAGWLATANYAGYLVGALSAARLASRPRRLVLLGLCGIALVTAAAGGTRAFAAWALLRTVAGVLSAWVLVGVGGWSLVELARRRRGDASGWVFAGVGLGITGAGSVALVASGAGSDALWLALGAAAALLALLVQRLWPAPRGADPAASAPALPARMPPGGIGLVLCYGSFGFGYILPATYLPTLARALIDDPRKFGLAWPVFGLAAAASTLLAARAQRDANLLDVWAGCHLLMAIGCLLPVFSHSGAAVAAAAVLVGGTFMVATMTGLQQARRLCPTDPMPLVGRMTAAFAIGQIAGPLVALWLAHRPLGNGSGIDATLALAAALLLSTAVWLRRMSIRSEKTDELSTDRASH